MYGYQCVNAQNPDSTFQSLEKHDQALTALARQGKRKARQYIRISSGTHFDPQVVAEFMNYIK